MKLIILKYREPKVIIIIELPERLCVNKLVGMIIAVFKCIFNQYVIFALVNVSTYAYKIKYSRIF